MEKFFVYFYYNKDDELLYVGQSVDVGRRWREHTEPWKGEVCKVGVREYPDSVSMDIFEYYYITRLSPKYNIARLHRGSITIDIPDSSTLTIYTVKDFSKKYVSKHVREEQEGFLSFPEELELKGKEIIDVTEINLFDKTLWAYDLDKVVFRYKNIYLSTYPFLFNTYNKNTVFRKSNRRIESLHQVLNNFPISQEQTLIVSGDNDDSLVKAAKTACAINPLSVAITKKNINTDCENFACSFSISSFDSLISYEKEAHTTTVGFNFGKNKNNRNYIKALNVDEFIISLPEILPTT